MGSCTSTERESRPQETTHSPNSRSALTTGGGGGSSSVGNTLNGPPTGNTKPLVDPIHIKWTSDTPLTEAKLLSMRDAFWHTAPNYGGSEEIWMALRAVCEAPVGDGQAILDSIGVVLPSGSLVDGCYDERGNHYVVPNYCLTTPINMVVNTQPTSQHNMISSSSRNAADDDVDDGGNSSSDNLASSNDVISVKIRLSTGSDVKMDLKSKMTFGEIKEILGKDIDYKHDIKFLLFGRVLEHKQKVNQTSLVNGSVLQAMIQQKF